MFCVYRRDGAWTIKGHEKLFFMSHEEALNAVCQIGANMGLEEFEVYVETPEEHYPSPYEQILGFQICTRCNIHPCEC